MSKTNVNQTWETRDIIRDLNQATELTNNQKNRDIDFCSL